MGEIKLFRTSKDKVEEIKGDSVALEKSLQILIGLCCKIQPDTMPTSGN